MLDENEPSLVSLDSCELAAQRDYDSANSEEELEAFRVGRSNTLDLLESIEDRQFERRGTFGEYGNVTLRSLVHYLSSHDHQHLACLEWLLGQIHAPFQGNR